MIRIYNNRIEAIQWDGAVTTFKFIDLYMFNVFPENPLFVTLSTEDMIMKIATKSKQVVYVIKEYDYIQVCKSWLKIHEGVMFEKQYLEQR